MTQFSVLVGIFKPDADGAIHFARNKVSQSRFVVSTYEEARAIDNMMQVRHDMPDYVVKTVIEARIAHSWVNCDNNFHLEEMVLDIQRVLKDMAMPSLPRVKHKVTE